MDIKMQIKPSVTNPTIADIYQNIESRKLILTPDFQRRFVWTHEHQEAFDLELPVDSIWFRKSSFFTLVVEVAKHNNNVPNDCRERLIQLEENILENKHQNNEFGTYYGYMYAGTNNRKARVERENLLNKYIYGE